MPTSVTFHGCGVPERRRVKEEGMCRGKGEAPTRHAGESAGSAVMRGGGQWDACATDLGQLALRRRPGQTRWEAPPQAHPHGCARRESARRGVAAKHPLLSAVHSWRRRGPCCLGESKEKIPLDGSRSKTPVEACSHIGVPTGPWSMTTVGPCYSTLTCTDGGCHIGSNELIRPSFVHSTAHWRGPSSVMMAA